MHKHIFVISHRRSGTHLLIDAISNNFEAYNSSYLNIDWLTCRNDKGMALDQFRTHTQQEPKLIKSHMHTDIENFFDNNSEIINFVEEMLRSSKIIYVHRDGRDVLTSLFFYTKGFNPKVQKMSFSDFIRMPNEFDCNTYEDSLNRIEYWKFHISTWLLKRDIIPISFENLIYNYEATVNRMAKTLGLDIPTRIKNIVRHKHLLGPRIVNSFFERAYKTYSKYIGGVTYTSLDFRKGVVGDYRYYFTQEDLEYFDSIASQSMIQLGYYKEKQPAISIDRDKKCQRITKI